MLVAAIRRFFAEFGLGSADVVAAVSGGVDSTALLLALADLRAEGFRVAAAHVNHHLRGADAEGDEAFVRDLCARLDVPLQVADGTLDPGVVRHRGIEAAAREVRYVRLRELAGERLVATAHQKSDQAETVLMRLLTGSGIAGLRGIHPVRGDGFIRPLLDVTREEIDAFLRDKGVTPRVDRSNQDQRFLRNRVRGLVRELGATDNLAAAARQAREQWPLLERLIDEAEPAALDGRWPDQRWLRQALLQRLIHRLDPEARDFDARRLAEELDQIKRASVSKRVELIRRGDRVFVERTAEPAPRFELELTAGEPVYIPEIDLTIGVRKGATGSGQPFQIDGPPRFLIRNRRDGDRFHPLGLTGSKKLKDFLIDRKIDAELRDAIPLLIWNGEIAWVGGVEVSERFKVTSPTEAVYEVKLEHASQDRNPDVL